MAEQFDHDPGMYSFSVLRDLHKRSGMPMRSVKSATVNDWGAMTTPGDTTMASLAEVEKWSAAAAHALIAKEKEDPDRMRC